MSKDNALLTREAFRESVLRRDGSVCVICKRDGVKRTASEVHHLVERRLFDNGGYFLDNGASVCSEHHIKAEQTTLSCEEIRIAAGIERVILPPHLYDDELYSKWGDPILPNGTRMRGELFHDDSVQKILAQGNVLHLYTNYVKYPRSYHLPFSPGTTKDDRVMADMKSFEGKQVVVTVKMDGENSSLYTDFFHARSLAKPSHPSQSWIKRLHGQIAGDIPPGWRLSCENLFATHSCHYKNLQDYVALFAVWNDKNFSLPWSEVKTWAALLGLSLCPVLYEGLWDEKLIRSLYKPTYDGDPCEGFVVRIADGFHYRDFRKYLGKYVRAGHVPVHGGHWATRTVVHNQLRPR